MERVFSDILGDTTYVAWTDDSRYATIYISGLEIEVIRIDMFTLFVQFFSIFAVGSKDATVRLYTLENYSNFRPYSLTGHSDAIVGIFFEQSSLDLMAVSRYVIDSSVLYI